MSKLENDGELTFGKINPRTVGFHIIMCMVKTIYALFINTGTIQFISWSDLRETGTITKALTGGDINQTIKMLKKLFVSLNVIQN